MLPPVKYHIGDRIRFTQGYTDYRAQYVFVGIILSIDIDYDEYDEPDNDMIAYEVEYVEDGDKLHRWVWGDMILGKA